MAQMCKIIVFKRFLFCKKNGLYEEKLSHIVYVILSRLARNNSLYFNLLSRLCLFYIHQMLFYHSQTYECNILVTNRDTLKALLVGFFNYIKLGILSLCTTISREFCLYWKATWWIDYVHVYRYWLWIHTHLSTTLIYRVTLNCLLILTHARRGDQYCRA